MCRDDADEVARLRKTCPRKSYTMSDAAYGDRVEFARDVALVMTAELRYIGGRLLLLSNLRGYLDNGLAKHHMLAQVTFTRRLAPRAGPESARRRERRFRPKRPMSSCQTAAPNGWLCTRATAPLRNSHRV